MMVLCDLVPTGRGTFVRQSEVGIEELLRRFDAAWPEHTIMDRHEVIAAYREAETISVKEYVK